MRRICLPAPAPKIIRPDAIVARSLLRTSALAVGRGILIEDVAIRRYWTENLVRYCGLIGTLETLQYDDPTSTTVAQQLPRNPLLLIDISHNSQCYRCSLLEAT